MKTTIDIADPILKRAKKLARDRHTTLKAVVENALRDALAAEERPKPAFRLTTRTCKGNGLQAGLSWGDWASIASAAYEGRGG